MHAYFLVLFIFHLGGGNVLGGGSGGHVLGSGPTQAQQPQQTQLPRQQPQQQPQQPQARLSLVQQEFVPNPVLLSNLLGIYYTMSLEEERLFNW